MDSTQTTDKCHRCKTRGPLTDEEISKIFIYCGRDKETFARAIERAHGIGGEK